MKSTADDPRPIRCPACTWLIRPPREHLDNCPNKPKEKE